MKKYIFFAVCVIMVSISMGSCNKTTDPVTKKFIGTYNVSDACGSGTTSYTMTIAYANNSSSQVSIFNFGGYGGTVLGTVSNSSISIVSTEGNLIIKATGNIDESRNTIQFVYSVKSAANTSTDNCSCTAVK